MSKIVIFDWGGVIMHKHPVDNNDKQTIIRTIKSFNTNLNDDEAWEVYRSTLADERWNTCQAFGYELDKIKESVGRFLSEQKEPATGRSR